MQNLRNNTGNFRGNRRLKGLDVEITYTKEQVQEFVKCMRDPVYFIETYMKIVTVDKGVQPFVLYPFQKRMLLEYTNNRFVVSKVPRQMGKSSVTVGFFLWYILFHKDKVCGILANKEKLAIELLDKIKKSYELLPWWLQQGVAEWNKKSIELENGSKIFASATSADAIRGMAMNVVFLDEYAFVPNNMAADFFTSVLPTISSGDTTKLFVVSTPKGMNHFYKLWMDAENKRNDFVTVDVHYSEHPRRDQAWADRERRALGDQKFAQECLCEFLGSQNTLISGTVLKTLAAMPPVYTSPDTNKYDCGYQIFRKPKKGHVYVVSADVGHGVGLDYTVAQVIDITHYPFEQVARYRNNEVSQLHFPNILYEIGKSYNWAEMWVESNDRGEEVLNILRLDLEYPNITYLDSAYGLHQTPKTKIIGCGAVRELIESYKMIIHDFETISELSNFVAKKRSYQADEGFHDDLVMALVNFATLTQSDFFKDLTDKDVRAKIMAERQQMLSDAMFPTGFQLDGLPNPNHDPFDYWDDGASSSEFVFVDLAAEFEGLWNKSNIPGSRPLQ